MVNKIDGSSYYAYEKPKKVNVPNTGEKFSLGYDKEGLRPGSENKNEVSDQKKQQAADSDGVRIELSNIGVEKQRQAEAMERPGAPGLALWLGQIRAFLTATAAAIKDIFSKIWNDPKQEDALGEYSDSAESAENTGVIRVTEIVETAAPTDAAKDTAASGTGDENPDHEIRQHLLKGDVEQVIRLLTDNGRKTPARNSSLLTCYDKNGRVVELDASVRQRALYGDRNTQKL